MLANNLSNLIIWLNWLIWLFITSKNRFSWFFIMHPQVWVTALVKSYFDHTEIAISLFQHCLVFGKHLVSNQRNALTYSMPSRNNVVSQSIPLIEHLGWEFDTKCFSKTRQCKLHKNDNGFIGLAYGRFKLGTFFVSSIILRESRS